MGSVTDIVALAKLSLRLIQAANSLRGSATEFKDIYSIVCRFEAHMEAIKQTVSRFSEGVMPAFPDLQEDFESWRKAAQEIKTVLKPYQHTLGSTTKGKKFKHVVHAVKWRILDERRFSKLRSALDTYRSESLLAFLTLVGNVLFALSEDSSNQRRAIDRQHDEQMSMMQKLLTVMNQVAPQVHFGRGNTFVVTDILGKRLILPTVLYRDLTNLHAYLQEHFSGVHSRQQPRIGHSFIRRGSYKLSLVNENDSGEYRELDIASTAWSQAVTDGAEFVMAIIMRDQELEFEHTKRSCPRCDYFIRGVPDRDGWLECESCEGRYRVSASGSSDVADAGLATSDATTRVAPFTNAGEDNRHTAHQGRYLPEDAPPDENARAVAKFCHRIQVSRATNICRWRKCGLPLDDLSPAGITRHLRAHHFSESSDTLLEWEKRSRGSCEWSDDTHACGRTMSHAGLGKHIAAVHFRTTLRRCPRCGDKFAGLGTFNRHFRELCGSLGDQSA